LDTTVSTLPWLRDQADVDAVIKGIENLKARLSRSNVTWAYPASNVSIADFVNDVRIPLL
jgi:cellobiose dehydrogenase (acceptor)